MHDRYIRCIQLNKNDPKLVLGYSLAQSFPKTCCGFFVLCCFQVFFSHPDFGNSYSRELRCFLTRCRGGTLDIWASNTWSENLLSLCFFQYSCLFLTFVLIHRVLKPVFPLTCFFIFLIRFQQILAVLSDY